MLSSYASDMNGLMDPSTVLKESKSAYERYVTLLEESERMDTENSE